MKYVITRWYEFSVYLAALAVLVLGLGASHWNTQQVALLLSFVFIQLHFFEEFGLPGGFAWGAIKVELGKVDDDVSKWSLNQLSAFFGNQWFAVAVYLLPLFGPSWSWAVLAVFIFAYAEALMHFVMFNVGLKRWYNPGTVTTVGLVIISTWYLLQAVPEGIFSWWDALIAIAWCALNYVIAFRSPITRRLNARTEYAFSRADVMKGKRYMDKFPGSPERLYGFSGE